MRFLNAWLRHTDSGWFPQVDGTKALYLPQAGFYNLAGGKAMEGKSHLNILVVEDHADTVTALVRLLERRGYRAVGAQSCEMARELYRQMSPDVCVIDIDFLDGYGGELLEDLTRIKSAVAAVAMTGRGMNEDFQRTREAGFAAHLVKPATIDQIVSAVEQAATREGRGQGSPCGEQAG